jgi:hypothetical protein
VICSVSRSREPVATIVTTGYEPSASYPMGKVLVERNGYRTIAVQHVNVDTLYVTQAAVPESLEARILAAPYWRADECGPVSGATLRPGVGHARRPAVSAVQVRPQWHAPARRRSR